VINEESDRLLAMRTLEAMRPKAGTKFLSDDLGDINHTLIQPGTIKASETFGGFIVRAPTPIRPKYMLIITENQRYFGW